MKATITNGIVFILSTIVIYFMMAFIVGTIVALSLMSPRYFFDTIGYVFNINWNGALIHTVLMCISAWTVLGVMLKGKK